MMNNHRESSALSAMRLIGYAAIGAAAAWIVYRVIRQSSRRADAVANPRENLGGRELTALLHRSPKTSARPPNCRYDFIDETVMQSFPASDPPASTGASATPALCLP